MSRKRRIMSKDNGGKFFLGALIGAAAGAIAGILFAPRSGKETRKIIGDKAKDYAVKGKETLNRGKEIAKEKIHQTAEKIAEKTK